MSTTTPKTPPELLHSNSEPKSSVLTDPAVPPNAPLTSEQEASAAVADIEALEASLLAATQAKAAAYVRDVANGVIEFDPAKGFPQVRVSDYAFYLSTHLAAVLGMSRKEVMTLALCHYARNLTSAHVTSQNSVALLAKGMQFVVQDLTLEVADYNTLALEIANREAVAGNGSV